MKKIVAIGGGEIGRPGFPVETTKIDREIIRLTKKRRPRLLFIPTASSDAEGYVKTVEKHFGERLSCRVSTLYLIGSKLKPAEIEKVIMSADIIYVGGGNTLKMMNIWRKTSVNDLLIKAFQRGVVLSGVSAGAICWFRYGHSDSQKFSERRAPFIRVRGLDLVPALLCPHYDKEKTRKKSLRNIIGKTKDLAIALDNCAALEILDGRYRLLTSKTGAAGYRCYWKDKQYHEDPITSSSTFRPLQELFKK